MISWSEEQKRVIESRGSDLLVSAAAGSGKTAVLTERIIQLIEKDGVSLSEIIVMTFTKAAASEMRERIDTALKQRMREKPGNTHMRLQQLLLPRARIGTVDSVCQGLIRQYYQELDIEPDFRVADDGEIRVMKNDALNELMSARFEEAAPDFMDLMDTFGKKDSDTGAAALIDSISRFAESQTFPKRYLRACIEECENDRRGEAGSSLWFQTAVEQLHSEVNDQLEMLHIAKEVCGDADGPVKYLESIEYCIETAEELLKISGYSGLYEFARETAFSNLPPVRAKDNVDPEKKEFVKSVRNGFKDFVIKDLRQGMLCLPPEVFLRAAAGSASLGKTLLELTLEFMELFSEKKRAANVVDFSDLEHLALELLYEEREGLMQPTPIADELALRLKEIMIDEYQDSNAVQDALLKALSAERFGRPDLFMVGDVKQSIYRFRQADPGIFQEKYNSFEDTGSHIRIELNRNFRSRHEVIDSVNAVFDALMRRELGGVEYDAAARLCPGAIFPEDAQGYESDRRTELLIMDAAKTGGSRDDGSSEDEETGAEQTEYEMIALRINELINKRDPEKSIRVVDKQTGRMRPAGYRDVVVLMRAAKKHAGLLAEVLADAGIPALYDSSSGYFSSGEVDTVISFLNIIDNPHQDIPLAAVMRSPLFDFTDEELALIRTGFRECAADDIDEEYLKMEHEPDFWDAVRYWGEKNDKVRRFADTVNSYRTASQILPVHRLIDRILAETGYYNYVSAMPFGDVRRKNLDALLERAEKFSDTVFHGVFDFIRYIEQFKENEIDFGEAGSEDGNTDAVRIMTIHGSKGLEYPIVFLARTGSRGLIKSDKNDILTDSGLGVAADYIDSAEGIRYPSLKKKAVRRKNELEDTGESLRLLYVAMTRAKEKLIITAAGRSTAKTPLETQIREKMHMGEMYRDLSGTVKLPVSLIASNKTYLNWVLLSAGCRPEHFSVRFFDRRSVEESRSEAAAEELRFVNAAQEAGSEGGSLSTEEQLRVNELCARFNADYPYNAETVLKPKLSVSEIKLRSIHLLPSSFETEDAGLEAEMSVFHDRFGEPAGTGETKTVKKGALYGTAFHRALELLPYYDSYEENEAYLKTCGRIREEELSLIDWERLRSFLSSELGRRMAAAHKTGRLRREQHFMAGFPARELVEEQDSDELQLLQGIIDAYIEEEDGSITLIDYKTDRVGSGQELKDRYQVQLELYKRALEQLTEKRVGEMLIYSTCLEKVISLQ
ncbi:MAG: helicase-exonuclease AddAB subunit AddA [Clostridiales bacterium]|nr:helicase-exonuclease AddAB subunit AddA [Clostridiales bacterium]